jgi:parallel beta-helix repeat protein
MGALVWLGLCLAGGIASAAEYYVSPDGDDANPGTKQRPFKRPEFASTKLTPGDTLWFRAGEYSCREDAVVALSPKRDGAPGRPITFAAFPGERAVIRHRSDWGVTPNGYDWIVFDGLEIVGGPRYGMKLSKAHGRNDYPHHITLRNLNIHGQGFEGIFAHSCTHLTIEHCHLHHSRRSHGLYLQVGCHNAVVRHNLSEENHGNSGMQLNAAGGGIRNALVEGNVLRNNAQGFSLMGVIGCTFRGNVLYNNGYPGPRGSGNREVILWTYKDRRATAPGTKCKDNLFEHNTFVNLRGKHIFHIRSGTSGTVLRNNILYTGRNVCMTVDPDSAAGLVLENNCLFNGGGALVRLGPQRLSLAQFARQAAIKATGNLVADPQLTDVNGFDLALRKTSPCIDAGAAPKWKRPFAGKAPDIGALELGSTLWKVGPVRKEPK